MHKYPGDLHVATEERPYRMSDYFVKHYGGHLDKGWVQCYEIELVLKVHWP